MKLTLEIDDRNLQWLKESLRVSIAQYKEWRENPFDPPEIVWRIFRAREALDLSVHEADMCHDYVYKPEPVDCAASK